MKQDEVIERLQNGEVLLYDNSLWFPGAVFKPAMKRVRMDTAFKIRQSGLVNIEKSTTAHGVEYLPWKGCWLFLISSSTALNAILASSR